MKKKKNNNLYKEKNVKRLKDWKQNLPKKEENQIKQMKIFKSSKMMFR